MMKNILRSSLLFLSFALLVSCSNNQAEESANPDKGKPVVNSTAVKAISYSDHVRVSGRLTFDNEYKLSFKTSGIVEAVFVKGGQYVKKGRLMATLKLDEIESKKKQADIAFDKAQRDFNRATALYADSVATLEQVENAKTQLQNTEMNLQTAKFNLKHSRIVAPANGIVQKVLVQENEMSGPGNPALIFGADNKGKVLIANIADADVVKIAVGDSASLHFDPYPESVFTGHVKEIAGMANPTTGTYELKIKVNDSNSQLRSGFIGSASLKSSQVYKWKEIPVEALVSSEKRNGQVYILEDGIAKKRTVKIERLVDDRLIVSEGLSDVDRVVSGGHHRLTGDHIKVSNQ
jgi:membrane fusion protein, multidrug efflux system